MKKSSRATASEGEGLRSEGIYRSVLGIDPGFTNPGFCFFGSDGKPGDVFNRKYPIVKYSGEMSRALVVQRDLQVGLEGFRPQYVIVEQPAVGGSAGGARAGLSAGMWMGIIYTTLASMGYADDQCLLVAPSRAKKFLTGNGAASKVEVALKIREVFGLSVTCDAESDATAIAYYGWHIVNNVMTGVKHRDDIIRRAIDERAAKLQGAEDGRSKKSRGRANSSAS